MRALSGPAARPIIAVHGGAWAIPDDLRDASLAGVAAAADAGHAALEESALDAVEAAVRVLEADPVFNAGRGASLNSVGEVELDAVIMDGRTLGAGAVAAIGPVRHPVSVARRLMEQTEHVLLVGAGATAFAREAGFTIVPADELVTEAARAEWAQLDAYGTSVNTLYNTAARRPTAEPHDTVGAVALDAHGNFAAATSTGGITYKRAGRVGDSPLLGSGCLADNALGAISTTGHGESILRYTLASRVLNSLSRDSDAAAALAAATATGGESGESGVAESGAMLASAAPGLAAARELEGMFARLDGGSGGCIVLSPSGAIGVAFTSSRMAWAVRSRHHACAGIDRVQEQQAAHSQSAAPPIGRAEVVPLAGLFAVP